MIRVTIDGVQLTYPDNAVGYFHTVVADESGDHVLISEKEWNNVADSFLQLQQQIREQALKLEHLSQQVSNISKSLRYVCLETESPIHFS